MNLENSIQKKFKSKKLTLSLAESCSGGNISAKLVSLPGASEFFLGSLVAYSHHAKQTLLNVCAKNLEIYGAVSSQVAMEMASGAKKFFLSDVSLATTGIAGPTGGTIHKPVGTVYIAMAFNHESLFWKYVFEGNRSQIIEQTLINALSILANFNYPLHIK